MLTKVTGGGCLLGAIVSAFIYNDCNPSSDVLIEALSYYNIAAEQAEQSEYGSLPGHFQINLLDSLQRVTSDDIADNMRVEEVS